MSLVTLDPAAPAAAAAPKDARVDAVENAALRTIARRAKVPAALVEDLAARRPLGGRYDVGTLLQLNASLTTTMALPRTAPAQRQRLAALALPLAEHIRQQAHLQLCPEVPEAPVAPLAVGPAGPPAAVPAAPAEAAPSHRHAALRRSEGLRAQRLFQGARAALEGLAQQRDAHGGRAPDGAAAAARQAALQLRDATILWHRHRWHGMDDQIRALQHMAHDLIEA